MNEYKVKMIGICIRALVQFDAEKNIGYPHSRERKRILFGGCPCIRFYSKCIR